MGAGSRGFGYARQAAALGAEIIAVADPDRRKRRRLVASFGSPATHEAESWEDLEFAPGEVDGVIIATMDDLHVEPTLRFSALAVPILLEKPIGRSWEECRRLRDELDCDHPPILVAHVLRYAPYTRLLRSMVDDGALGDVVNVHHYEPVGFWHFAHSFVRGNWRSSTDAAAFMVAKACHDVDWIMHLIDAECVAVSSFASLSHFRPERRPQGAAERCVDCTVDCVFDARSIYLEPARAGDFSWPVDTICVDPSVEAVADAVEHSRFGRCVYNGGNDAADTQVASMLFAGGQTATVTVSAFTELRSRTSIVAGTRGEATVTADGIEIYSFADRRRRSWTVEERRASGIMDSHGGGDDMLMERFLSEINRPTEAGRAAFSEALRSHQVAFAIEEASRRRQVVDPRELDTKGQHSVPCPLSENDQPGSHP